MTTPEQVVQRQLDAYNAHDIETFAACHSQTVVYTRYTTGETTINGREDVVNTFGPLFAANPALHCAVVKRMTLGRFVIDQEHITGFSSGETRDAIVIYEVAGGLIHNVAVIRG